MNLLVMRIILLLLLATPAAAQLPRLTPMVTIGCDMCEGPEAFGAIQTLGLGPGTVVVADRDPPRVRVFGTDGRLRWATGRDGDGPGEQRLVIGTGVTADGGVVTLDMRLLRLSRFDQQGTFVSSQQVAVFPLAMGFHSADDRVLITATDFRNPVGAILWLRPDGQADTVVSPMPFAGRRGHQFASPVVRRDGGFALGEGQELYHIVLYARDGTVRRTIVRDIARTRRTPEEIAAAERRVVGAGARRAAEGGSGAPAVDPFRSHFTALDALAFDDQDRLWVRTERGGPGRTVFDLFDPAGEFVGEVGLELAIDFFRVAGGVLAAVTAEEDGTERVRLWRVEG